MTPCPAVSRAPWCRRVALLLAGMATAAWLAAQSVSPAVRAVTVAPMQPAATRALVTTLFQPFLAEQVALAPDGRHVAYTEHRGEELAIIILQLEEPYAKVRI